MSWFRLEFDLPGNHKPRALARELGVSRHEALGILVTLWCEVGRLAPDGSLVDYAPEDVEDFAGWRGEPGQLVQALLTVGLLDEAPEGLVVHGWIERAEAYRKAQDKAKQRAKDKAKQRPRPVVDTSETGRPKVTTDGDVDVDVDQEDLRPGGSATRAPAPPPATGDEQPPLVLEAEEAPPAPDVVVEVPCRGRQGRPYAVTRAELDAWAKAYPGVNVEAQARKAAGWAQTRPSKRKAHRNIPRWLCDVWFAPELGKGPSPPRGGGRQAEQEARNRAVLDAWEREQTEGAPNARGLLDLVPDGASGWVEAEADERGAQAPERSTT